jgi:hypothetical protein
MHQHPTPFVAQKEHWGWLLEFGTQASCMLVDRGFVHIDISSRSEQGHIAHSLTLPDERWRLLNVAAVYDNHSSVSNIGVKTGTKYSNDK